LWSQRWQHVFSALGDSGTGIVESRPNFPGAPADTDLGCLQRAMRSEPSGSKKSSPHITGDGSLLLLRGETSAEVAELTAALLVSWRKGDDQRCAPLERTQIT